MVNGSKDTIAEHRVCKQWQRNWSTVKNEPGVEAAFPVALL